MTGQPAVAAGAAGNRLFDRLQRREPTMTTGHILLMVLWNQTTKTLGLSLTVSEIFNGECDAMVDMTLNDR